MTETPSPNEHILEEEEFIDYSDYDLEDADADALVVPASEALPYPDKAIQDDDEEQGDEEQQARSFVAGAINVRSPEEAIAFARSWSQRGVYVGVGQCLRTVRTFFNVSSKYGTAAGSWWAADHKHRVRGGLAVPRGVPVYWTGGSSGAGHVALSVGGGVCLSTDWKRSGRIDYARINDITSHWGLDFQGFANEINDVQVWRPMVRHGTVSLRNLHLWKKNRDVLQVKQRLRHKGYKGFSTKSSRFGLGTKRAYAKYQRRLGYSGSGANGIPGSTSLRKLGFRVKP